MIWTGIAVIVSLGWLIYSVTNYRSWKHYQELTKCDGLAAHHIRGLTNKDLAEILREAATHPLVTSHDAVRLVNAAEALEK